MLVSVAVVRFISFCCSINYKKEICYNRSVDPFIEVSSRPLRSFNATRQCLSSITSIIFRSGLMCFSLPVSVTTTHTNEHPAIRSLSDCKYFIFGILIVQMHEWMFIVRKLTINHILKHRPKKFGKILNFRQSTPIDFNSGSIMFHVRRRPADSQPRRRKKKPLGVQNGSNNVTVEREGPMLVEITHSGDGGRRVKLTAEPVEVGKIILFFVIKFIETMGTMANLWNW